jgi:hypothetical protein
MLGILYRRSSISCRISAGLLTGASHTAIEESTHAPVKNSKKKIDRESYPVKPSIVPGALYAVHAQYVTSKRDPFPTKYSRHSSVRWVSIQPYKQVNAVIAVMHVVGLLRLVEAGHPIKQQKKRAK